MMMGMGFVFIFVVGAALLVAIAGGAFLLASGRGTGPIKTSEPTARDILRARLARGEITQDQYAEILEEVER